MSVSEELRTAIDARDFRAALRLAEVMPEVGLEEALGLTLLAAEAEPELYESMARGWLARLVYERDLSPSGIEGAARVLARVGRGSMRATDAISVLEGFAAVRGRDQRRPKGAAG